MKTIKDIFSLNLNTRGGATQFYNIINRYIINKKDKKELFKEIKNINEGSTLSPRCFILNKKDVVCSTAFIEQFQGGPSGVTYMTEAYVIMIGDSNFMIDKDEELCNIDTWIEINKDNIHKEITYEDFLGNKVDGYFSKIRVLHPVSLDGELIVSSHFIDNFSKQRINYLKNNLDKVKYNMISLTSPYASNEDYTYITNANIVTENNEEFIIFDIEQILIFGNTKQIKISLNAEVIL